MSGPRPGGAPGSTGGARDRTSVLADALERELLGVRALPLGTGGRRAALDAMQAALAALTRPRAGSAPHERLEDLDAALGHAQAAIAALDGAPGRASDGEAAEKQALEGLRGVEQALAALREVALQGGAARFAPGTSRAAPPLRASLGTPALHAFERAPILPLAGLDRENRWLPAGAGAGEAEQARRLARDCMEDIAILGDLRRRGEREPWTAVARFEQRLLDNLDALVALARGPSGEGVIEQLQRYAAETLFPDRGRAFALALVLGCLDGEDAVRAAVMALRHADPSTVEAYQAALSLGSSPAIGPAMERLLWGEKASSARLALEVLRHRREASLSVVAPLLDHPDPRVAAAAARAAAVAGVDGEHRAAVLPLLEPRLTDPDDEVAVAAAEALLVLGAPAGLLGLRKRLKDEVDAPGLMPRAARARATRLLALAGGPEDLELLLAAVRGDPPAAEALGWLGHPGAAEPLLELLERAAPRGRAAQLVPARALHRLTGAGLRPPGEIVEAIDDRLILEAAPWRALWEERRRALARPDRIRFGAPYTLAATVDELLRDEAPPAARREAALELAIALGPALRVEVDDWAARQRAALLGLREQVAAAGLAPGEYLARALARRPKNQG